jgi:hypothetical protein
VIFISFHFTAERLLTFRIIPFHFFPAFSIFLLWYFSDTIPFRSRSFIIFFFSTVLNIYASSRRDGQGLIASVFIIIFLSAIFLFFLVSNPESLVNYVERLGVGGLFILL